MCAFNNGRKGGNISNNYAKIKHYTNVFCQLDFQSCNECVCINQET